MRPSLRCLASLVSLVSGPSLLALLGGCGATAEHPLTLVPPDLMECARKMQPCTPVYASCEDLALTSMDIEVGVFKKPKTRIECPASLSNGPVTVSVSYTPGLNYYMIDTSYGPEKMLTYIASGPFTEDEAATPWRVILR